MNILMIGPSNKLKGGVATVINNYIHNFNKQDINLMCISTIKSEKKINKIIDFIFSLIKVIIILITKKIDLVHIHMASRGSYERKKYLINISKLFNKKVIIHLHGAEFKIYYKNECNEYKKSEIRKIFNKVDRVIVLSDSWKEFIKKITETKIEVLYNSVNISENNLYNSNSKNILFLGRLEKRKGVYDILEICHDLERFNPEIKILLCGNGEIEQVNKIIKDKNIKNIQVLGWINNKEKESILKSTLVNILPSYNEGMPMTILELMGMGIFSISTTIGGIPEVIENNKDGILIEPGDKRLLLQSIKSIVNDKELRENLSENAYLKAKGYFNINENIKKLKEIYEGLIIYDK